MKSITFILGFMVFVSGCAEHPASTVAFISGAPGHYEVRLVSSEIVAGGPCNFPQWPHREYESYWIYSDTTNGVVPADRLTVAYGQVGDSFRATQEGPLLGSVSFSSNQVHVAIETPYFTDGVHLDHYQKFPLNGTYRMQSE